MGKAEITQQQTDIVQSEAERLRGIASAACTNPLPKFSLLNQLLSSERLCVSGKTSGMFSPQKAIIAMSTNRNRAHFEKCLPWV